MHQQAAMTSSRRRCSRPRALYVSGLVLFTLLIDVTLVWARNKTDVVVLGNGDRVTCEIETLQRGRLTVKTDSMGTLQIEWDDVQQVTSPMVFEVELENGERFVGTLEPPPVQGQVLVSGETEAALNRDSIVRMREIGQGFWSQIDGSMDVGFDFTKANESRQWTFMGEAIRRGVQFETRVNFDSLFSSQEGIDSANRQALGIQVTRFLPQRWMAAAVAQFQRNEELDLDLRSLIGGGAGRYLLQTNRTILSVLGGIVFNRERFAGPGTQVNNAEALGLVQFRKFTFDDPETDIETTLLVLPSLTEAGRVRLEFNARVRREVLKDFYWNISFFESFDSEPPSAASEQHDYGLVSSFGWSF